MSEIKVLVFAQKSTLTAKEKLLNQSSALKGQPSDKNLGEPIVLSTASSIFGVQIQEDFEDFV